MNADITPRFLSAFICVHLWLSFVFVFGIMLLASGALPLWHAWI